MKKHLLLASFILFTSGIFAQSWTTVASFTTARGQHGAVAAGNKAYVFGGYALGPELTSLEIYDATSNTWSTGAPLGVATRGNAHCLGMDGKIYTFCGYGSTGYITYCAKYDVSANTWTTIASPPTAVWEGAAATAPNGKICLFGGENGTNLTQIYDPSTDTWSAGAPLPNPVMMENAVTALNGKIYVIGGLNGSAVNYVQIYDPVADSWTSGTPMPTARNQFAACIAGGMIYTIGGKSSYGNNSSPFYNTNEIYDPVANTWTTSTVLPQTLGELECAVVNGSIYVFGGTNGQFVNTTYRMDVTTGIKENNLNGFNIFPNPAKDKLSLSLPEGSYTLVITDAMGREMLNQKIEGGVNELSLDLSGYQAGIYFVKLSSADQQVVKKLLITN